jgi:hypothetical protein
VPVDDSDTIAALSALVARVEAAGPTIAGTIALRVKQVGMGLTHVRSGTLRRSWQVTLAGSSAEVGPTTVYARRQELGFSGADSLGRIYRHDPGWPYVRPAFDIAAPQALPFAERSIAQAIEG